MNFYIASKLENFKEVRELSVLLKGFGWVHTYDWTTHGSVKESNIETLREVGQKEFDGVRNADIVIVLTPQGRGTHVELGMAIALNKIVYICHEDDTYFKCDDNTSAFYWLANVRHITGSVEMLAKDLKMLSEDKWKKTLDQIAIDEVNKHYHGNAMGSTTNLHPITDVFLYSDTWTIDSWDNVWCAAFVYHCIRLLGYDLPIKFHHESVVMNFAGVPAWEQWAKLPKINKWIEKKETPQKGDIVLFRKVYDGKEPDHIGIVTDVSETWIQSAEGNFNNVSAIIQRPYECVYGYIRL